jgi:transcriptional regulator
MFVLTDRQLLLWRMRLRGMSISEIASRLGISRQAVHKGLQAAENKVYKALVSVAAASKIEVRRIDVEKGVLVGWSPWLKTDVYITFSSRNGVQIWFRHEGDCKTCPLREECIRILLSEADERGIKLPSPDEMEPSQLADILFEKILEER